MNRLKRDALRAFRKAGLEVEIREDRNHLSIHYDGDLIHTITRGSKTHKQAETALLRKARQVKAGKIPAHGRRFNRD